MVENIGGKKGGGKIGKNRVSEESNLELPAQKTTTLTDKP